MSTKIICPRCRGSGKEDWFEDGVLGFIANLSFGRFSCRKCNGSGYIYIYED